MKRKIKVLFIARATLFDSPGGDTVQISKTAESLGKLGVEVEIGLTNQEFDYEKFDLVHFFNIIRPADIIKHLKLSKHAVVSSIFVDYTETEIKTSGKIRSILTKYLGGDKIEYMKAVAKHFLGKEVLISKEYLRWGHKKSVQFILNNANAVLPNSWNELKRLDQAYGVPTSIIAQKVVNAVEVLDSVQPDLNFKDSIICIGRIERRKNQLNLIKAMNSLDRKCYIIGKPAINDPEYYEECVKEADDNIEFIQHIPQKDLYKIMKSASVHVLPSWFETTGLVSLEAAYYGCKIVVTEKGDQKEYFEDYAFYCEPQDINSIKNAIKLALNSPFREDFKNKIKQEYTWENAAQQTLSVYHKILES